MLKWRGRAGAQQGTELLCVETLKAGTHTAPPKRGLGTFSTVKLKMTARPRTGDCAELSDGADTEEWLQRQGF